MKFKTTFPSTRDVKIFFNENHNYKSQIKLQQNIDYVDLV